MDRFAAVYSWQKETLLGYGKCFVIESGFCCYLAACLDLGGIESVDNLNFNYNNEIFKPLNS